MFHKLCNQMRVCLLLFPLTFSCFLFSRKMQISGAPDLASKGQCISDSSNVKVKGEIEDPFQSDIKVRCLCGRLLETESMIKVCFKFSYFLESP